MEFNTVETVEKDICKLTNIDYGETENGSRAHGYASILRYSPESVEKLLTFLGDTSRAEELDSASAEIYIAYINKSAKEFREAVEKTPLMVRVTTLINCDIQHEVHTRVATEEEAIAFIEKEFEAQRKVYAK